MWEGNCHFHSTVDVEYTQAPFYLALWPELLGYELDFWPEFARDARLILGEKGAGGGSSRMTSGPAPRPMARPTTTTWPSRRRPTPGGKGIRNPWTGETLDLDEIPGWDSAHIYTANTQQPMGFFETFNGNNLHLYPRGVAVWGFFDALAGRVFDAVWNKETLTPAFPQIRVPILLDADWKTEPPGWRSPDIRISSDMSAWLIRF